MKYTEIENCEALRIALEAGGTLRHYAFQGIDFNKCMDMAMQCRFSDCLFLGGFGVDNLRDRMDDSCSIFPRFQGLPFRAFRSGLYSAKSLYEGYRPGDPDSYKDCYDSKVYEHYLKAGKQTGDIKETLARILHDHSMNDGLDDFLRSFDEKSIVSSEIYQKLLFGKLEVNEGMFIENIVAQMLTASGNKLFFYSKSSEKAEERMEIDFLLQKDKVTSRHNIRPLEVKSGKNYTLSSLTKCMKKFGEYMTTPTVLHAADYKVEDGITYLPLYMTSLL